MNNGKYWQFMRKYFESQYSPDTDSRVPSQKKELAFLLPKFAYDINAQPISGWAAVFREKRDLDRRRPVFKLA